VKKSCLLFFFRFRLQRRVRRRAQARPTNTTRPPFWDMTRAHTRTRFPTRPPPKVVIYLAFWKVEQEATTDSCLE
jgi:hypothetical protein